MMQAKADIDKAIATLRGYSGYSELCDKLQECSRELDAKQKRYDAYVARVNDPGRRPGEPSSRVVYRDGKYIREYLCWDY
jgi:hypothetical protein